MLAPARGLRSAPSPGPEQVRGAIAWVVAFEKELGSKVNLAEFKRKGSVLHRVPEVLLLCWKTLLPGLWSRGWGVLKAGDSEGGGSLSVVTEVFE